MSDSSRSEERKDVPDIRKEEPTVVHNIRQLLGCLPVLGSITVGFCGLVAFGVAMNHICNAYEPSSVWLIGGSIGLIASGIGFAALGWIVWSNRQE